MDLRMKCRQKCKGKGRGWPRQRRNCGGAAGRRPAAPPQFLFCCAHPLPGVPLTFLSDISYGDPWKIIINFSNANANANPNANANAKVLLTLILQQVLKHHPPFLFGWVGGCCASSSARGPLDISVCHFIRRPRLGLLAFLLALARGNSLVQKWTKNAKHLNI